MPAGTVRWTRVRLAVAVWGAGAGLWAVSCSSSSPVHSFGVTDPMAVPAGGRGFVSTSGTGGTTGAGPDDVVGGGPDGQTPGRDAGARPDATGAPVESDAGGGQFGGTPGGGTPAGTSGSAAIVRGPEPTIVTASSKGPYTVKTYTSGMKDEPHFGAATVYYPTDAEAPFAAVAICPGFTATQSSIAAWGPFLASHGIVVMTIDTNTTGDSVVQRSTALLDALDCLRSENTRSDSPLVGRLDTTRMGLMGWSMGGGGTWIDASTHPELKTAITLAGHIASAPGGTGAITTISVPTLMFAGQTDSAVLGGGMSQPIYDQIPDPVAKMLYEVAGAGHDVANNPANNNKNIGLYGLSWQKVFLEGDGRYRQFLLAKGPNASDFRTNLK